MVMTTITGYATGFISQIGSHFASMPATEAIIFDIAIILIISAIFAFLARILRQPLIPAYVLAGLIIGPLILGFVRNLDLIYAFSEIGIAFLLFTAGLEISFKKIKEVGLKKIALIGILQVAIIFGVGLFFGKYFGLSALQAGYIGIILAFGSTMVDIKLLADKGELVTLHGRLVLGILLLQDLVAILAIIVFMTGGFAIIPIAIAIAKLVGLVIIAILLQKLVLNRLFRFAARSTELLFLSALAVLFLFILLTYVTGLSIVIGAFIAGVSLANSPFKIELESRINPLRDFFAILFFVALGMQIVFTGIAEHIWLFVFLLGIGFIAKPLITFILVRITGYRSRTSFMTAISLAQLSEFSLIIGMLGVVLGALTQGLFSVIILATIITMAVTPYFIEYKNNIYKVFKTPLKIFNFLPMKENLEYGEKKDKKILLVGVHRIGSVILNKLIEKKDDLIVIDYDPEVVSGLIKKKISTIYGDLGGAEILQKINVKKLKLVISTVPDIDDNLKLLKKVKELNPKAVVILTAQRISEALHLYKNRADYVILPKIVAGEEMLEIISGKVKDLKNAKQKQIKNLEEIHKLLY